MPNVSQARSSAGIQAGGNSPWYARLWTVKTEATPLSTEWAA